MIAGDRVLGLVPARGGSKGFPRKNLAELGGRTLLAWAAEAGRAAGCIDRLVVSSDDAEILAAGRDCGLETPFVRPAALAQDETPGVDPVLHALDALEAEGDRFGWVVLLQPTSPLRRGEDIAGCVARCLSAGAPACVSVVSVDKSPFWMFRLAEEGALTPLLDPALRPTRRQDAAPLVSLNGAVYLAQVEWLRRTRSFLTEETVGFVMPASRSVDIDEPHDLRIAAALLGVGR